MLVLQSMRNLLAGRPVLHVLVRELLDPHVEVGEPGAGGGAGVVVEALVVRAHAEEHLGQDVGGQVHLDEVRIRFGAVTVHQEFSILKNHRS